MNIDPCRAPEVQIDKLLPERRQRKIVTAHCGCCCCCCCCLHSVGGLVGAAIGSSPVRSAADEGYYIEDENDPGQYRLIRVPGSRTTGTAVFTYWITLAILCGLTIVTPLATKPEYGIGIVIMALPGVQIAASFVALIVVACRSGGKEAYVQIGKITLWTVIGTAIGLGVMYLTCIGLSGFKGIF